MAPIAPFYADRLYQDLDRTTSKENISSVHLAYFPKGELRCAIDKNLELKMQRAQRIVSLVLSIRKKEKIKVGNPYKES
jgi:isoleucyl-tRNA synthetase